MSDPGDIVRDALRPRNMDAWDVWNEEGPDALRRCVDAAEPVGVQLGDFHAYMPTHQYIWAPARAFWAGASINARLPKQKLLDRSGRPVIENDKPVMIPAAAWLDRERPVEDMTWAPGEPMIIQDRIVSEGGWIRRLGCSCFNFYRPPTIVPGDENAAQPWIDHVQRVYPNDWRHIVRWLAHRAQRPGEKINHALVLGGNQGIGKDTILEPAKHAVGPWNCVEISPKQMMGRFNGFVKSVILRVSEARDLGDVDRFAFYDHMKTYTAAPPDVLRVDEKNVPEHGVFNVCGVIITTNHKTDGIYIPADDRRHFVAWSEATKDDFDEDYWRDLYGWYEAGGIAHVVAYLRSVDLTVFNPKAPPPKTAAFWEIVDANRAPEDADLADALEAIGWPDATTLATIAYHSADEFAAWLRDRKNARRIPHRLDECGYVVVRNDERPSDGLWKISGKSCTIYAKKDLSVRDRIAAAQRLVANTYPRR